MECRSLIARVIGPPRLPSCSQTHYTLNVQEKTGLLGPDQAAVVHQMVKAYVEGLCWVMAYYYDGVASWTW